VPVTAFHTPRRRHRGVSIVESLVALLVLSIGLLGIAGLFVDSVKNSRAALLRTQAINVVSDMADRIRANTAARDAYDTSTYGGAPAKLRCSAEGTDEGVNCSVAQLAEDDLARWIEQIKGTAVIPALLPGTNYADAATVEYVPAAGPNSPEEYIVRVRWLEPPGTVVSDDPLTDQRNSYEARVIVIGREPVT
jgi:type IV pilus assembly protein PilV